MFIFRDTGGFAYKKEGLVMKQIGRIVTSFTLVLAVTAASVCGGIRIKGVTPEVKETKAASAAEPFIDDIAISYASSREEAQNELGDEYTILENKVGECWVGYTTTDDQDAAIRDIKVQSMSGKYSVSDYEELLKNHKEAIKGQVETLVPALIEFTKNHDSGLGAAMIIYKNLNCFYEDDSDMAFGDFLLEQGHRLISDSGDATATKKLEKIYTEANADLIQEMESLIAKGTDTKIEKKGTWLDRMSELGPHGLIDIYKQAYKNLKSDSAVNKKLENEYGDDADVLLKELKSIQSFIREKEGSDVAKAIEDGEDSKVDDMSTKVADIKSGSEPTDDSTVEEIAESMGQSLDALPEIIEFNENVSAEALVLVLKATPYGDQTMYDLFMNEKIEKSDLYTMAYVLTEGQKSIIGDTGLYSTLMAAATGYAEETEDTDDLVEAVGEKAFSIYDGVDRSVFEGDTALTEDALKRMQTEDDNSSLTASACVSGLLATFAACIGVYCSVKLVKSIMNPEGITTKKTKMKIIQVGESSESFKKADKVVNKLQNEVEIMSKNEYALRGKMIQKAKLLENFKFNVVGKTSAEIYESYLKAVDMLGGAEQKVITFSKEAEKAFLAQRTTKLQEKLMLREKAYFSGDVVGYRTGTEVSMRPVSNTARICYVLGAVVAFAFAGYEIYQMVKKDPKVKYTDIPAKMVSRTYDDDQISYMTYGVARTKDGKKADLRNWKGKEWVALYTTSDKGAGDPILASTLMSTDKNAVSDSGYNPVSEFCYTDVYNVSEKNDTYLFFKSGTKNTDEDNETEVSDETEDADGSVPSGSAVGDGTDNTEGSVFGGAGIVWIILLIVVVIGVGGGTAVYFRKRKKSE